MSNPNTFDTTPVESPLDKGWPCVWHETAPEGQATNLMYLFISIIPKSTQTGISSTLYDSINGFQNKAN